MMTEAEKIIREKAVWLVVGGIESIVGARLPPSLMASGSKFLCAIMPLEDEEIPLTGGD
jgi:hypothetical protein